MTYKELKMDSDAGKQMQDGDSQAGGPSELERMLSSFDSSDEGMEVTAPEVSRPEGYRGAVDDPLDEPDLGYDQEAARLQASVLEKINYEDDTQKFFMDDPDNPRREPLSEAQRLQVFGKKETAMPLEALNGPPLVFGGMLLGISLTLIVLISMGKLEVANSTNWYIFSGIGAAIGLMYAAQLRT